MAVTTKILIDTIIAPATYPGSDYNAPPGVTTIIDKFTARNYSAASSTITVWIGTESMPTDDTKAIVKRTMGAGESYLFPEIVGQVLKKGVRIWVITSPEQTISYRMCGREIN